MCGEKLVVIVLHKPLRGITPACAGKSIAAAISDAAAGDHPRMCGEKMSSSHISSFR